MATTTKKQANGAVQANLRFTGKAEFLKYYLPDVGIGGFQWVTDPIDTGTSLQINVTFIGHQKSYLLTGQVVWRQSSPPMRPELPKGVGLEFSPESQATLRQVLEYATLEDKDDALKAVDDRRLARIRVQIACQYLFKGKLVSAKVMDISEMGLYIETDQLLPEGTRFVFYLLDDQVLRPLVMEGTVVWSRSDPDKPGFGVQLVFDSQKHKIDVKRYVNNLNEAFEDT